MNIKHCRNLIETFVQKHDWDKYKDKAGEKELKGSPKQLHRGDKESIRAQSCYIRALSSCPNLWIIGYADSCAESPTRIIQDIETAEVC